MNQPHQGHVNNRFLRLGAHFAGKSRNASPVAQKPRRRSHTGEESAPGWRPAARPDKWTPRHLGRQRQIASWETWPMNTTIHQRSIYSPWDIHRGSGRTSGCSSRAHPIARRLLISRGNRRVTSADKSNMCPSSRAHAAPPNDSPAASPSLMRRCRHGRPSPSAREKFWLDDA